jgi:hypothetical protein
LFKNKIFSSVLEFGVVSAVLISILYGTTFQEFRRFADSYKIATEQRATIGGDRGFYLSMSTNLTSETASNWRNYRIIVPWLVHYSHPIVERLIGAYEPDTRRQIQFSAAQIRPLLFYFYNFLFFYTALMLLYFVLKGFGFGFIKCLFGVSIVATSRVVSYSIGSPLVDSVFYCAISFIMFLIFQERSQSRTQLLFLTYPILMISKELIVPIAALPFLKKRFRTPYFFTVFLLSLISFFVIRLGVDTLYDSKAAPALHGEALFFTEVLETVLPMIPSNLRNFLSFSGLDHLLHGFIFFAPMALIGAFLPSRLTKEDKLVLNSLVAIGIGFAVFSYESGRTLFAAFPAVTIYFLVFIEFVENRLGQIAPPPGVGKLPEEGRCAP